MNNASPFRINQKGPKTKCVPKTTSRAICPFMSLKANTSRECWYVDNGCSRHMLVFYKAGQHLSVVTLSYLVMKRLHIG